MLWALTDNQGSVRDVVDGEGNVVNHITYDSFGQITAETNPDVDFRFTYTGREFDSETGQYFYRAKAYDPTTGQFINEDTIGFASGDTNLYRYVINSPLNYTDPSGNIPPLAVIAIITILSTIVADLISPDGVQAPTAPKDAEGNLLSPEDLDHLDSCSNEIIFDNRQNLDKSLERAGWEIILGGIPGGLKNLPNLLKSLADSSDEIAKLLGKGIDNLLPSDLDSIPVLVDGFFDDAVKQIDKFDNSLTDGNGNLKDVAPGVGAAVDDLFKPFFESKNSGEGAYHGPKPELENPGHHDPTSGDFRGGGSKTTPIPQDAQEVYKNAIPTPDGTSWYGRNAQGDIYRYSGSKTPGDGTPVHFNGSTNSPRGLKVPEYI